MQITKSTDGDWNLQLTISCLNGYQEQETKLLTASPDWSNYQTIHEATVMMLTATNMDRLALNSRSETSQQYQTTKDTTPLNTLSITNPATSDLTTVETTLDTTLKPLTAKRHETLCQM